MIKPEIYEFEHYYEAESEGIDHINMLTNGEASPDFIPFGDVVTVKKVRNGQYKHPTVQEDDDIPVHLLEKDDDLAEMEEVSADADLVEILCK